MTTKNKLTAEEILQKLGKHFTIWYGDNNEFGLTWAYEMTIEELEGREFEKEFSKYLSQSEEESYLIQSCLEE